MTEKYTITFEGDIEMEYDEISREQFMDGAEMDSEEEFYGFVEQRVEEQLRSVFMHDTVHELTVTVSGE